VCSEFKCTGWQRASTGEPANRRSGLVEMLLWMLDGQRGSRYEPEVGLWEVTNNPVDPCECAESPSFEAIDVDKSAYHHLSQSETICILQAFAHLQSWTISYGPS
jgi:hypothetical protein